MKNIKMNSLVATVVLGISLASGIALPAFALTLNGSASLQVGASSSLGGGGLGVNVQASLLVRGKDRADQEIERRDKALAALSARIDSMQRISADQKTTLTSTIQAQINELATLKAKIDADTDTMTLRTDVLSITKAYRIFALVIPQGALIAAADREEAIVDTMTTLGVKLQARIAADQAAGKDVTAEQTAYADFQAKLADAKVQAQASITEVSGLTPDNGDQTKFQANRTAMKDARSKIQAAQQDFVAARKDAETIVKGLRVSAHASSTVEASTTEHGGN